MLNKKIGVIGAGSFGSAVANKLAQKSDVLLYARNPATIKSIESTRISSGHPLAKNITITNDLEEIAGKCNTIFPVIPSANFREMMVQLSPFLHPYHTLIHGTKGLDLKLNKDISSENTVSSHNIKTMSEVIREESVVVRVGCMAGPNIASELTANLPAATVIASPFNEVIAEGTRLLRSENFLVYGNSDLKGVELCGVLKNIIAIAAGITSGLKLGENAKGLLISRGIVEMIYLGQELGGEISSFIGLAGIGDLVTTASSTSSRNFTCGFKLAEGKKLGQVMDEMEETAEGINTIKIIKQLAVDQGLKPQITEMLYRVLYKDLSAEDAVNYLMRYPGNIDIDFL